MPEDNQIINCSFTSENALLLSYMSFIQDGGLFVHTKNTHELDDQVTLSVTFLDETEQHLIEGRVVWITPKGAQGNKPAGIGVQFTSENKGFIRNKIETLLAGKLKSSQSTDTM